MTKFFPLHGEVHSRSKYSTSPLADPRLKFSLEELFALARPTVHFSVNAVAHPNQNHKKFNNDNFVVIDSLQSSLHQIAGGYIEDLFSIGTFKLSKDAVVLAPKFMENTVELNSKIKTLPAGIKVIYYEGELTSAVENYLKSVGSKYLHIKYDEEVPQFFGTFGSQCVSSKTLLDKMGKLLISHDITPLSGLENIFLTNPTYNIAPYIEALDQFDFADVQSVITAFAKCISQCFKLKKAQATFLERHKVVLTSALSLFATSNNLDELSSSVSVESEVLKSYDYETDLDRPVIFENGPHRTSLSSLIESVTELSFAAFYRRNCTTVVDLVFQNQAKTELSAKANSMVKELGEFIIPCVLRGVDSLVINYANVPSVANDLREKLLRIQGAQDTYNFSART